MNTEPLPPDPITEAATAATRPLLPETAKMASARQSIAQFGLSILDEVRAAIARDTIVVVGMAQNPFVRRARKSLTEAGLPFTYLEYGSYFSRWRDRLAIKLWSGWPTFPQVFVRGALVGGYKETTQAILDGSLRQRLDAKT